MITSKLSMLTSPHLLVLAAVLRTVLPRLSFLVFAHKCEYLLREDMAVHLNRNEIYLTYPLHRRTEQLSAQSSTTASATMAARPKDPFESSAFSRNGVPQNHLYLLRYAIIAITPMMMR